MRGESVKKDEQYSEQHGRPTVWEAGCSRCSANALTLLDVFLFCLSSWAHPVAAPHPQASAHPPPNMAGSQPGPAAQAAAAHGSSAPHPPHWPRVPGAPTTARGNLRGCTDLPSQKDPIGISHPGGEQVGGAHGGRGPNLEGALASRGPNILGPLVRPPPRPAPTGSAPTAADQQPCHMFSGARGWQKLLQPRGPSARCCPPPWSRPPGLGPLSLSGQPS